MILTLNFFLSRGIYQLQVKGDENDPKHKLEEYNLLLIFSDFQYRNFQTLIVSEAHCPFFQETEDPAHTHARGSNALF